MKRPDLTWGVYCEWTRSSLSSCCPAHVSAIQWIYRKQAHVVCSLSRRGEKSVWSNTYVQRRKKDYKSSLCLKCPTRPWPLNGSVPARCNPLLAYMEALRLKSNLSELIKHVKPHKQDWHAGVLCMPSHLRTFTQSRGVITVQQEDGGVCVIIREAFFFWPVKKKTKKTKKHREREWGRERKLDGAAFPLPDGSQHGCRQGCNPPCWL